MDDHDGRPPAAGPVGKVVYVVANLGAIGNERIDAVTLTDRQIISQRTPISVNRSWSQAQLNLQLEPCRRDRMPNHGWPALRRLRVIHAPELIHGIHREGFLPRAPSFPETTTAAAASTPFLSVFHSS